MHLIKIYSKAARQDYIINLDNIAFITYKEGTHIDSNGESTYTYSANFYYSASSGIDNLYVEFSDADKFVEFISHLEANLKRKTLA